MVNFRIDQNQDGSLPKLFEEQRVATNDFAIDDFTSKTAINLTGLKCCQV
jgi:hypothetical protein